MHLKKESRILVVEKIDNAVAGAVIRGVAGVEDIVAFSDCVHLINF